MQIDAQCLDWTASKLVLWGKIERNEQDYATDNNNHPVELQELKELPVSHVQSSSVESSLRSDSLRSCLKEFTSAEKMLEPSLKKDFENVIGPSGKRLRIRTTELVASKVHEN